MRCSPGKLILARPYATGVVLLLGFTACDTADAPDPVTHSVRDSAGVQLVRGVTTGPDVLGWSLSREPIMELVSDDRPLHQMQGAVFTEDGSVLVTNLSEELLLFDPDGTFRAVVGEKGSGPGEFEYIRRVAAFGDTIAVLDIPHVLTLFVKPDTFLREIRLPTAPQFSENIGLGSRFFTHDRVVPIGAFSSPGRGFEQTTAIITAFDLDTGRPDTIQSMPSTVWLRIGQGRSIPPPYMPTSHAAFRGDQAALGWSGAPEILEFGPSGSLLRRVFLASPQPRFRLSDWCTPICESGREGEKVEWLYPEVLPFFDGLLLDSEDRLWVKEFPTSRDPTSQAWTVLGESRRPIGRVVFGSDLRLMDVRDHRVLVIRTDDLDVQHLEVYTLAQ